jgi:glutamine synthetase
MSTTRFSAVQEMVQTNEVKIGHYQGKRITDIFNSNVFVGKVIREYLSDEAYKSLQNSIKNGVKIERKVADQIASGMRTWAESKGVTHYTHWFQP